MMHVGCGHVEMPTSKADWLSEPVGPKTLHKGVAQLLCSFPEVFLHQEARHLDWDDALTVPAGKEI